MRLHNALRAVAGQQQGGGGVTDPAWSDVFSLIHFDDADGTLTPVDQKGLTWTAFDGAAVSTAVSKFGAGSLFLDGSSQMDSDLLASDWKFLSDGLAAYTAECFVRLETNTGTTQVVMETGLATSQRGFWIYVDASGAVNTGISKGTSGTYGAAISGGFVGNSFVHVAVSYDPNAASGNKFRLHVAGQKVAATDPVFADANPYSFLTFGRYDNGNNLGLHGHIDESRITKNVAIYDGNFTPPSAPFPNG